MFNNCLTNRPIAAYVPVGAVDSTLGEVTSPYVMYLPSIKDAGTESVIISPFTSLLSNAISKSKADAGLVQDLTVAEGCQSIGTDIASRVSSELNQIVETIEQATGISYQDILSDFIDESPNEYLSLIHI